MKPHHRFLLLLFIGVTALAGAGDIATIAAMLSTAEGSTSLAWGSSLAASLLFTAVGTLVIRARAGHPVGWAAVTTGAVLASYLFADVFFTWSVSNTAEEPFSVPAQLAAGARQGVWLIALWAMASLALFYPTGRFPSRWWRPAYLVTTIVIVTTAGLGFILPLPLTEPFERYSNPLGIRALASVADALVAVGLGSFFVATLAVGANLLVRAWRSVGDEREQFKWFAASVSLFIIAQLLTGLINPAVTRAAEILSALAILAIPLAIGIAILRYRLYDIDVLVSKTLVYAPLTAVLAGAYSAAILFFRFLFQGATGRSSEESIVLTTLVIAALFVPVKNHIQSWVDRLFKEDERKRLGAYLSEVERASDMLDPQVVLRRFALRAAEATGASVRIVLNAQGGFIEHPEGATHAAQPLRVPLNDGDRPIGSIELSPARTRRIRTADLARIQKAAPHLARLASLTTRAGAHPGR